MRIKPGMGMLLPAEMPQGQELLTVSPTVLMCHGLGEVWRSVTEARRDGTACGVTVRYPAMLSAVEVVGEVQP